jgi:hypothetical protein
MTTQNLKENYVSSGNDILLHTLQLNHTTFSSPYYIVQNNEDFVANLENSGPLRTFQKYSFTIDGPSKNSQGNQYININIDAVNTTLVNMLENTSLDDNNNPIELIYRVYLASDTTTPQADPTKLYLKNVSVDNYSISGQAVFLNLNNAKFPNVKYDNTFQNLIISV